MGPFIRFFLSLSILRPIMRPAVRWIIGIIAIPLFRLILRKGIKLQELDKELEKDLEQWFRGSLLLLAATANMEHLLFEWVPLSMQGEYGWLTVGLRLMLAIGVIETMPDQQLFSIIHPGPSAPKIDRSKPWWGLPPQVKPFFKGVLCQHINRSSPVFALLAAIFGGDPSDPKLADDVIVGWVCYFAAITQYLIIGLVTSKDKALDALSEFDRRVAERRQELVEEFSLEDDLKEREAAGKKDSEPQKESVGQVSSAGE
ncbi:DNA topoisomerase I [Calycomorphotria hydatis]|uniref:Uncharacterized protein n=1 Tax=Calycomorphotria hydatis TaxID=2528027 RepID=A0A517TAB7_9PLAN|nr:DNA topoisomerase I [Calycomorphotria hydatis]QDT65314.1 hypothetical protein V22_25630 [Calycomorphotria hydatis]